MATVTTTLLPIVSTFPFTGYVEPNLTPAARGEVLAVLKDGTWTASGAGDNQRLIIRVNLPNNFAYVVTDVQLEIKGSVGLVYNVDLQGALNLYNAGSVANRTLDVPIGLTCPGDYALNLADQVATYRPLNLYKGIVIPAFNDNVRLECQFYNTTANDQQYDVDFVARFLQFDINQVHALAVNTAIPTR